jgi:hypothetical protein
MWTFLFVGILSAYALNPTIAQTNYQQSLGNIPEDLSEYDALIAVDHCGLIGKEAILHTEDGPYKAIVFDCAGSGGAHFFSDGNDLTTPYLLAGEVDKYFWDDHPDLIGTRVTIEVIMNS